MKRKEKKKKRKKKGFGAKFRKNSKSTVGKAKIDLEPVISSPEHEEERLSCTFYSFFSLFSPF